MIKYNKIGVPNEKSHGKYTLFFAIFKTYYYNSNQIVNNIANSFKE